MGRLGVVASLCAATALLGEGSHAREVSGVDMPEAVSVAGRELRLNGAGLSSKTVFFTSHRVYVVGLYLERPTRNPEEAISTDEAKRISIVMLHDVGRDAFVDAVEKGIERNSGPVMPSLRGRLDLLERALPDLKAGDVVDFTYVPGVGTLVRGQGEEMAIPGKDFADALFSVWLGPRSLDDDVRRELLGS